MGRVLAMIVLWVVRLLPEELAMIVLWVVPPLRWED